MDAAQLLKHCQHTPQIVLAKEETLLELKWIIGTLNNEYTPKCFVARTNPRKHFKHFVIIGLVDYGFYIFIIWIRERIFFGIPNIKQNIFESLICSTCIFNK
jgi:hypothetical protein